MRSNEKKVEEEKCCEYHTDISDTNLKEYPGIKSGVAAILSFQFSPPRIL
jgi:hypothetical protein